MTQPLRFVFRWFVYAMAFVLLLLLGGMAYIYTHEAEIKREIVVALNQRLKSPVKVNGPIYVSWFEDFPSITLSFPNLSVAALQNEQPAEYALLSAGRLSLSFSLRDLYRGQYQLQQLTITDAQIDLRFDEKGNPNYLIWKSDSSSTSATNFAIQKLVLRRVQLNYQNASENQLLSASLTDADFKGNFSDRQFRLQAKAALQAGSLQLDGKQFLKDQPLSVNLSMEVDLDAQTVRFPDSELRLNREKITLSGFHHWAEPLETDLQFAAEKFRASQLLALYGGDLALFRELDVDGELQLSGRWQYRQAQPLLELQARLSDAKLRYPSYDLQFKGETNIIARFDRPSGLDLRLEKVQLQNKTDRLSGQLRYLSLTNLLTGSISGQLALEGYAKLLATYDIREARGMAKLQQQFRWELDKPAGLLFGGELELSDASMRYGSYQLQQLSAKAQINEKGLPNLRMQISKLQLDTVMLSGQLNLTNYPALYSRGAGTLAVSGQIKADRWRWASTTANDDAGAAFPPVNLQLGLEVGRLYWYDYRFNNLKTQLSGNPQNLRIRLEEVDLAGGKLSGLLQWDELPQFYRLQGSVRGRNTQIQQLFAQFNDFGQDFLTQKHLSGRLNSSTTLLLYFDKNFNLLPQKMEVLADLDLEQGALTQFEPMNSLSRFVDAKELQNLRFQRLRNHIEIRNGKISVPEMDINSNATHLAIAGEHTLDNAYKYYIQVSLSDLWQKRTKQITFDPSLAEARPEGGVKLYLLLEGQGAEFTIRYNKLEVRDQLRQQAKEVRKDISRLVQEELDGSARNKTYQNNRLDDIAPIAPEADTLEAPKEKDFDPVYLRKPKGRRGG